jgi:serine/threonine protein kinase
MTVQVGQVLGAYRLKRRLGRGAFADVFLGEHIHLRTLAAIKVLRTSLIDQEDSFLREARTIARLKHDHIVNILDFEIDQQGHEQIPYLVMDYAKKGDILERHPRGSQSRPTSEQISLYVEQIASALNYAHTQKQPVIHRDVKPENILIGQDDRLLLSDFGIAVILEQNSNQDSQMVAGTKTYIAPEQIRGNPLPQSDQYALAIIVYEWICGEPPFATRGRDIDEILLDHLQSIPPSLRSRGLNVSPRTEAVLARALAKDPQHRYATINEFAQQLKLALKETPGPTILPSPFPELSGPSNAPTEQDLRGKNSPASKSYSTQSQTNRTNYDLPLPDPTLRSNRTKPSNQRTLDRLDGRHTSAFDLRYLFAHKRTGFRVVSLLLLALYVLFVYFASPSTNLWLVSLLVALPLFGLTIIFARRGTGLILSLLMACYWGLIGVLVSVKFLKQTSSAPAIFVVFFGVSRALYTWYVWTKRP